MKWRAVRTIARKDLDEVRRNRSAWMPALIVPLVFVVVLPLLIIFLPGLLNVPTDAIFSQHGWGAFIHRMPITLLRELQDMTAPQVWVVWMTGYMLAPLFLMLPLTFSCIVGADSFVGERERKTLEALLNTPTSDGDLFLGKVLASVLPAIAISWLSFGVYTLVVNAAGWSMMGGPWFPRPTWWPLILWVTPAVATLGMAATVLVSSRVNTFMEAYQLSELLMVLVLGLVVGQVSGVLVLNSGVMLTVGVLVWAVDVVLLRFSVGSLARQKLIARL